MALLLVWALPASAMHCLPYHKVITAVHNHWNVCGVSLLHSPDIDGSNTRKLVELHKLLSTTRLATAVISLRSSLDTATRCGHKPPLHVVLSAGRITRHHLEQISATSNLSLAKWLLFLEAPVSLEDFFGNVYVPFNCQFLVAEGSDGLVTLTEVYRVSPSQPLHVYRYGNWTLRDGATWNNVTLFRRRSKLDGLIIRTSYVNEDSLFHLNQETHKPGGYFGLVWGLLEMLLHFTSVYVPSKDGLYGSKLGNGSFDGMVNMVQHNEVHITCRGIIMNPVRADVIDYITPLLTDRTHVFVKEPNSVRMRWTDFIRPFERQLWVTVAGAILVLSICLWASRLAERMHGDLRAEHTMAVSLIQIFASFCMQGQNGSLGKWPYRVVLLTSYATAFVLLPGFSASLISALAARKAELPFTSFRGLLEDGTHEVGMLRSSAHFDNLKELVEVFRKLVNPEALPRTDREGLERVCVQNKYAYIVGLLEANIMSRNLSCRVTPLPDTFTPTYIAMAIAKGSPYRSLFNFYLQEMRRAGILQRLQRQSLNTRLPDTDLQRRSVSLVQVAPLFIILALGAALSVLLLFAEIFIWRRNSTKSRGLNLQ